MLFTEGKDRKYERMMQEKPGFQRDRRRVVSPNARQRDCPHCLYYNETLKSAVLQPALCSKNESYAKGEVCSFAGMALAVPGISPFPPYPQPLILSEKLTDRKEKCRRLIRV